MKKQVFFMMAMGAMIGLHGCASHELQLRLSGAEMLNQTELEHLFRSERTVEFSSSTGKAKVMYFPDERQEVDWGAGTDKGNFRIQNEEFCSTWSRLRNGAESCSRIHKIGEKEFEFIGSDGTSHAIMRIE
jgi:hypothetical protein